MARQTFGEAGAGGRPAGQARLAKLERFFFVLGRTGMLLHRCVAAGPGGSDGCTSTVIT
jgi:hypothetical protein